MKIDTSFDHVWLIHDKINKIASETGTGIRIPDVSNLKELPKKYCIWIRGPSVPVDWSPERFDGHDRMRSGLRFGRQLRHFVLCPFGFFAHRHHFPIRTHFQRGLASEPAPFTSRSQNCSHDGIYLYYYLPAQINNEWTCVNKRTDNNGPFII